MFFLVFDCVSFIVPEDFGFQLTILAEYSPQVNILPATTAIFRCDCKIFFLLVRGCMYQNSATTGKFHQVNSQNGIVAQAMLVMQLLKSLPTCMATIRKIHQTVYGSGEPSLVITSLVIM